MMEVKKLYYEKSGKRTVEALRRRHFDAWYCADAAEALNKIQELIPADAVVSWGGSVTVDELGLKAALRSRGQPLLDRDSVPMEQKAEIIRCGIQALRGEEIEL